MYLDLSICLSFLLFTIFFLFSTSYEILFFILNYIFRFSLSEYLFRKLILSSKIFILPSFLENSFVIYNI